MANEIDVSVVLPCRDEEKTIGICIGKIQSVFRERGIRGEIIVSDSSKDSSPKIAESLGARVVVPWNKGYGNAYLAGFAAAHGKIIMMGDADDTYDFLEMPRLLEPLKHGKADLVLGSRLRGTIMPGAMPALHRYVGNPALSFLLNLFFGTKISDAHTGFRAISREALVAIDPHATGMEFASEMIFKAAKKKLKIAEVPITYHPRQTKPHLESFSDGWRHLRFMLLYAPNYLFLAPGAFFFTIGVALMALLLGGPAELFGATLDIHPMIAGSFMAILGFQLVIMGLFTKAYAASVHFEEASQTLTLLHRHFTLERASLIGLAVLAAGFALSFDIFYSWLSHGQGALWEIRRAIFSTTLMIIGVQTVFSAFFLSVLAIKKRD
ncbi:MAG: glycosyltransferase family 2 protein [Candidatus Micrarchaeia archaeon]|jgi:glycosyltransferase involved in cell wall biosynthesis